MKLLLALIAFLAAALCAPAFAAPFRTDHGEVELHSSRAAIAPGETFTIVLRQTIAPGWHTYWINPGAAGEPTEIEWRLPAGARAGPIQWPAPNAIPFQTLVNFGYSDEVLLPIELTAPANLRPGETLRIAANATWVVCSDVCVFEQGPLELAVPVAAAGRDDSVWAARAAAALAALPQHEPSVRARISRGPPARLSVALPESARGRVAHFFPVNRDAMDPSADQAPRFSAEGVSFSLTPGVDNDLGQAPLEGVVTIGEGEQRRAYAIVALPGAPLFAPGPPALDVAALVAAAGLAFLGGLILNIMPCVLPVLSVKALSLAGGAHAGEARRQGLWYFLGAMATFLALAVLLIALRAAGQAAGWGFQLQSPWVTSALALLFFLIGLNLLGAFSLGGSLQGAGRGLAGRRGEAGAFFTGALAVIAATPCTAPFMAGAIGVALTQSAPATLLIFAALGLGFALPLTALHLTPRLQRLIPKPGLWMERAKQALAFPMFAAAIWLAWVLAEQAGAVGVQSLLNVAAALAFALFVARWGRVWTIVGLVVLVAALAMSWRPLAGVERQVTLVSEPWSAERVAQLRAEGRPVFVNFTAAWCITCKANELVALQNRSVADAFANAHAAYLVGDWTNRDDAIARALAEHGRAGVPLYLYYPARGAPVVLPQVLTPSLMVQTIAGDER
jgi:thiol:disulfide interchange protein DsbD